MESKLEELAKYWFNIFHLKETGKPGNWDKLQDKRKADWMEEVLLVSDHFMGILLKDIRPLAKESARTQYSLGFLDGRSSERTLFINMVKGIAEDLHDDYDYFKTQKGE